MKKLVSVLTAMILVSTLWGQNSVKPVNQSTSTSGIYYSLPQTIVQVEIKVKKEAFYAGPLAEYADDFLGKTDVKTSDETSYSIVEVSLTTATQPDPGQFYFLEFNPDELKESRRFLMSLNESGILQTVNSSVKEKSKKSTKTIAKAENEAVNKDKLFNYQAIQPRQLVKDTTIRMITVDTSVKRDITINTEWVDKSEKEIAAEVAQRIQKIHQDRYYLSIGYQETPYDEGAIKYMDKNLITRQEEYQALFTGKTVTSYEEYHFDWIPAKQKDNITQKTLCKFSIRSGIRPANSSIGLPVTLQAARENTTMQLQNHATRMKNTSKEKKGVYYRIPDFAKITVLYDGEEALKQRARINQFGVVSYAPYTGDMNFQLHPESGALKNIELLYRD